MSLRASADVELLQARHAMRGEGAVVKRRTPTMLLGSTHTPSSVSHKRAMALVTLMLLRHVAAHVFAVAHCGVESATTALLRDILGLLKQPHHRLGEHFAH